MFRCHQRYFHLVFFVCKYTKTPIDEFSMYGSIWQTVSELSVLRMIDVFTTLYALNSVLFYKLK